MKSKVIYGLNFLWTCLIAFSLPVCLGWIYMDITGNAKGFGYNLGSETDLYLLFGIVELLIWLILAVPSGIYIFRKTKAKGNHYLLIPLIVFAMLFILCIHLIGGWHEFGRFFHG